MLLDLGRHLPVELIHLELVLEVGDRPQPLHDRVRAVLAREVDDQGVERSSPARWRDSALRRLDELDALLGAEQRLLLAHGLVDDRDDHVVEHLRRALDDVEVAERDRVVGPRAHRGAPLRSAATVDRDPGVAVDALVHERQVPSSRGARLSDSVTVIESSVRSGRQQPESCSPIRVAELYGGSANTRSYGGSPTARPR